MTTEIDRLCDHVLAVKEPEGFASALAIPLALTDQTDTVEFYEGVFPIGAFAKADLRVNRSTALMFLVLEARPGDGIPLGSVRMDRYAAAPIAVDVNAWIPPDGTSAYVYLVGGVRLTFEFTLKERFLRAVSFEWPPRT